MPSSICWEGKVLDFHFKPLQINHSAFYIGDILVGQIFKHTGRLKYWTAVALTPRVNNLHSVSGFGTRWKAAEWLLKAEGYTTDGDSLFDDKITCDTCEGKGFNYKRLDTK